MIVVGIRPQYGPLSRATNNCESPRATAANANHLRVGTLNQRPERRRETTRIITVEPIQLKKKPIAAPVIPNNGTRTTGKRMAEVLVAAVTITTAREEPRAINHKPIGHESSLKNIPQIIHESNGIAGSNERE